jgi:uncharacterized repeat protein (TIGR01451 family)
MTNSNATPSAVPQAGARRRRLRPFVKGTLAAFIAMVGVGFFSAPAFAHANTVAAPTGCLISGSNYVITWTISNDYMQTETATVTATSATGGLATVSPTAVNIALTPGSVPPDSTGTVTQTLPATTTGTISLTVQGHWSDGTLQTAVGNVTLGTGCSAPSVGVTKSVSTSFVNNNVPAGSSSHVVYTLAVKNNGQLPTASNVVVTDAIPTHTTYVAGSATCVTGGSPTCSAAEASGKVTFTIGSPLFAGSTYDVSFAVTVDATAPTGSIPNTGNFTGPGCTTVAPGCATNTVTITVTNNPILTVVKSANVSAVTAGQSAPVIYTLTVSNQAPSTGATQSAATVSDVVPSGLTFVSASCGALNGTTTTPTCTSAYNTSTRTVTYSLGAGIALGSSFPLTFSATVNASDTTSIVNSGTWTGPGCTPTAPATTCSTNTVTITVANFTVSKADSAGSNSVNPGDVVTYTLSAKNIGTGPGSITVTDGAPTGTTLTTPAAACPANTAATCSVTVTGSNISWIITNLPAGATYDLTFAVKVNPGTGGTHILNTGVFTEPGCTTVGGCDTNTTDNPVPPPTSSKTPTTTTTTMVPTTTVKTTSTGGAIKNATTVHTGEPWAGSTPYVLAVLGFGLSLLGFGASRRRRSAKAPTA